MSQAKQQSNRLRLYRQRMGFSPKLAAQFLGHKDSEMLLRYERGSSIPPLMTALRLEILYRSPLSELYWPWYEKARQEMRQTEKRLNARGQQSLFNLDDL